MLTTAQIQTIDGQRKVMVIDWLLLQDDRMSNFPLSIYQSSLRPQIMRSIAGCKLRAIGPRPPLLARKRLLILSTFARRSGFSWRILASTTFSIAKIHENTQWWTFGASRGTNCWKLVEIVAPVTILNTLDTMVALDWYEKSFEERKWHCCHFASIRCGMVLRQWWFHFMESCIDSCAHTW